MRKFAEVKFDQKDRSNRLLEAKFCQNGRNFGRTNRLHEAKFDQNDRSNSLLEAEFGLKFRSN